MTTITLPRAVVEQALKALEGAAECVQQNYLPDKCGHDWDEQIIALRAALAQQAEQKRATPVMQQALEILESDFTTVDGEFCRWCDGRLNAKHNARGNAPDTARAE